MFNPRLVGQLVQARGQDQKVPARFAEPYINASGETVVPINEHCDLEMKRPALAELVGFDRFVPPRIVCRRQVGIELEIRH
ncbi:MAG: hypothetical protein AAFR91_02250 [Pseudomonadota bacterium]